MNLLPRWYDTWRTSAPEYEEDEDEEEEYDFDLMKEDE